MTRPDLPQLSPLAVSIRLAGCLHKYTFGRVLLENFTDFIFVNF